KNKKTVSGDACAPRHPRAGDRSPPSHRRARVRVVSRARRQRRPRLRRLARRGARTLGVAPAARRRRRRVTTVRREPFVLVADDDRDTRELYRACFDTNGYHTAEAGTGSQAIASAVEMRPEVLLADYVLPDIDGLTVARRLKADPRTDGIRILLVTGYANPD